MVSARIATLVEVLISNNCKLAQATYQQRKPRRVRLEAGNGESTMYKFDSDIANKREFRLVGIRHGKPVLYNFEVHFPIESSGLLSLVEIHINDELINVVRISPCPITCNRLDVIKLFFPTFGQEAKALDFTFVIG